MHRARDASRSKSFLWAVRGTRKGLAESLWERWTKAHPARCFCVGATPYRVSSPGCEYDQRVQVLTAADPERGIDWTRLRELVEDTSDDDLQAAKSDYPWSAIVEIRSLLLERVAGLEARWQAIFSPSADRPRRLELEAEEDARAVSVLSALSFLQPAGAIVEDS